MPHPSRTVAGWIRGRERLMRGFMCLKPTVVTRSLSGSWAHGLWRYVSAQRPSNSNRTHERHMTRCCGEDFVCWRRSHLRTSSGSEVNTSFHRQPNIVFVSDSLLFWVSVVLVSPSLAPVLHFLTADDDFPADDSSLPFYAVVFVFHFPVTFDRGSWAVAGGAGINESALYFTGDQREIISSDLLCSKAA